MQHPVSEVGAQHACLYLDTRDTMYAMRRHLFLWLCGIGALAVAAWLVWGGARGDALPVYESVSVERGVVAHIVSVTGHVEPTVRVDLAFPVGGILEQLLVEEDAYVAAGTLAASLGARQEYAAIAEAEARLLRERAVYEELRAPLRDVAVAVEDAKVAQAAAARAAAEESARVALARAFVYADDALHEEVDELFDTGGGAQFGIDFTSGDTTYFIRNNNYRTTRQLNEGRAAAEAALEALEARTATTNVQAALRAGDADLQTIEGFVTLLAGVVNDYISEDTIEQAVYEAFQTTVASARTALASARSELAVAQTTLAGTVSAEARAADERTLAAAGATRETLATQQAAVALALRSLDSARTRAADKQLNVPVSGRITAIYPSVGEAVQPYAPVLELIARDELFEVEAYIPEADIADVALGDQAEITFDAFRRDQVFMGEVVRIALTETVREGVPTYKTTLVLTDIPNSSLTLRPGMTADVDITTDSREDVLSVPTRSVLMKNGASYVRVVEGGSFVEREVETGLRSSVGTVEVLAGVREGEEVVLYVEDE